MSLQLRLTALAQAIGSDIKTLQTAQGNLAALDTTAKGSLVAAINELAALIIGSSGAAILDTAGTGDTAHTWSADKIVAQLLALKTEIVDGAPAAYDTLMEIGSKLTGDDTAIAGLLTAVGERVSFATAQALTAPQQAQACGNLGIGNPETDLAAAYTAAKA